MTWWPPSISSPSCPDARLAGAAGTLAALAGAVLLGLGAFLLWAAAPALDQIGLARFFTDAAWHPLERQFNLQPMLWGTLAVSAGALLLAAPLGLLSALFTVFYAPPRLGSAYRRLVELLAGIPSVVYGLWGLVVLVPLINQWRPPGTSLLAGMLVLTLMILPTVALTAEAALRAVPRDYLNAAAALGLGRAATLRRVVLPAARGGIVAGLVLAAGRAVGETMAVLMVTGNVVQNPASLFAPVRTLAANIALEMAYALDQHRAALFVSGLVLAVLVAGLMSLAGLLGRRLRHV
ncbi:MAG TPA: phosphate ABC transporter permease subunit PstC [Gammaproteobacteria bacterium]|nr:phosphate ABC transporter permease subunit PstC [Gammaproteobacteria bacterium]